MAELHYTITKEDGIKALLQEWANKYNCHKFIALDPIQIPRKYYRPVNIEISAFVTAWLSFGNRKAIIEKALFIDLDVFKEMPYLYIVGLGGIQNWRKYKNDKTVLYRFFTYADFYDLCERLFVVYTQYASLELYLLAMMKELNCSALKALQASFGMVKGIPNDESPSACKRLCMFMRWMVRNDETVDMGVWKKLSPKDLIIPLDTHVHQVALALGITKRKQADMRTAMEITDYFKGIFPEDPARGDFALFGAGVNANAL